MTRRNLRYLAVQCYAPSKRQASRRSPSAQDGHQNTLTLGGFAAGEAPDLPVELGPVEAAAPFRKMVTPGGWPMSVAMTNCGGVG